MYTPYIERQKWLPWQCPLVAGYRQYLHFVGQPLKPRLHNQLPSRDRSDKASYSKFSPKNGSLGNGP